jgi:hypothetical protein
VCLIPGAGEFTLATEAVLRRTGLTKVEAENVHAADGRPDLIVSLDQLEAQCPNLTRVNLVIGWFGDRLEAGTCRPLPAAGVSSRREKPGACRAWVRKCALPILIARGRFLSASCRRQSCG